MLPLVSHVLVAAHGHPPHPSKISCLKWQLCHTHTINVLGSQMRGSLQKYTRKLDLQYLIMNASLLLIKSIVSLRVCECQKSSKHKSESNVQAKQRGVLDCEPHETLQNIPECQLFCWTKLKCPFVSRLVLFMFLTTLQLYTNLHIFQTTGVADLKELILFHIFSTRTHKDPWNN